MKWVSRLEQRSQFWQELWMKWVCAKAVLRLLTNAQRDCWKTVASELCGIWLQDTSFLGRVVIGNESWVFTYNPQIKWQSSKWYTTLSPGWNKSWMANLNLTVVLKHSSIAEALSVMNLCLEGQLWMLLTVWKCCHIYGTKWEKWPEKWHMGWILPYDNAQL